MQRLIFILFVLFLSCNSQKLAPQNVVIRGKILNSKNDTLYISKLNFDKISDTDTIIIDNSGSFKYEFTPEQAHFYVLAHKENNYVRLLIDKGEQLLFTADLRNIPASYDVKGSKGTLMLKRFDLRTAKAMQVVDSLTQEVNKNKGKPQFKELFLSLDSIYKANFLSFKNDIKLIIEEDLSSLASVVGIYQSLNGQSLFNPLEDFDFFCRVNDSVYKYHPENSFAINLYNRVLDMKLKDKEKKHIEQSLKPGILAGDIIITDRFGTQVKLSSLKGKVVLLKFWDSHCSICKQENNTLKGIYAKYKSKGFEIFAVSADTDRSEWLSYLSKNDFNWIHSWLYDETKNTTSPITSNYFIENIPVAHLIGKDGKFITPNIKNNEIEKELEKIFK